MKTYTYSNARQNLATLLSETKREGQARILRKDGDAFLVTFVKTKKSPLDVKGYNIGFTREEILETIREIRSR